MNDKLSDKLDIISAEAHLHDGVRVTVCTVRANQLAVTARTACVSGAVRDTMKRKQHACTHARSNDSELAFKSQARFIQCDVRSNAGLTHLAQKVRNLHEASNMHVETFQTTERDKQTPSVTSRH